MAVNDATIWIYLGKRDKSGVMILTQLQGKKIIASRLSNIDDLKLPIDYKDFLKTMIYENRMLYEPWIESASNYTSLREQLKARGYSNIPVSNLVQYGSRTVSLAPEVYTKNIHQVKVMVRKTN